MKRSKQGSNPPKQQRLSFAPEPHSLSTVDAAIKCLSCGKSKGVGKEKIIQSLTVIENASLGGDFSSENIIALVDIIGSKKLSLQISKTLIKYLLNQEQDVPEDSIISAVSWICTQKLHMKIQTELLKWILQVFDTTERKQTFSYLYGVIFNFLDYDELVPFVCPLLSKMTEKYHVVPFRVRHLLEVLSRLGPELYILVLLNTFSQHRPDLLNTQIKVKSFLRCLGALPSMLQKHSGSYQPKNKNHRKEVGFTEMVIHERIQSFCQLHEAAQSLNTPQGLLKLLTSPKRRILFTSGLSTSVLSQFSLWMRQSLAAEKPLKEDSLRAERAKLLILASDISEELQEGIPEVEGFVKAYLTKWNGHSHYDLLLDVIQYWKFCSFEALSEDVLVPIFKYFRGSSVASKCCLLECYTKLYQRWALWEVQRHEACRNVIRSSLNLESSQITVFGQELRSEYPDQEVESLATYIANLCIVALQLHPDHPPVLLYQILMFFEVAIHTHNMNNTAAPLILPPTFLLCAAAFASSAAAVSQMCSLIISYKETVDNLRATNADMVKKSWIDILNSCLLDICDTLWRCLGFVQRENSLLYCKELPQHVCDSVSGAKESFSLYHHPALFGLANIFVHRSRINVPLRELLHNEIIRDAYLTHLSNSGLKSIVSFVRTFIRPRDDITKMSSQ